MRGIGKKVTILSMSGAWDATIIGSEPQPDWRLADAARLLKSDRRSLRRCGVRTKAPFVRVADDNGIEVLVFADMVNRAGRL